MLVIKIAIYSFIFLSSSLIGILVSRKYVNRVNELREFKNALNIFKTKIRYTYETLPDIFTQISESVSPNISRVFKKAAEKMSVCEAGKAWSLALEIEDLNINNEDINVLENLSKLLGKTDLEGQLNQIEISEKMYRALGMIMGMAIVIILI